MATHFSHDRDLIIHEPALMRDVAWNAQRRLNTTGSVAATVLTLNSGSFTEADIQPGHVVIFDGVTLEIISIDGPTTATVSLMRANLSAQAIPPFAASNRSVVVYDFSPQRAVVHRQILAMLAIDPDGESSFGINETQITNPKALTRLETLGTLSLIYASAAAPSRADHGFEQRARLYCERFQRERESVVVMLDTDNDAIAEATRRPNAFIPPRA